MNKLKYDYTILTPFKLCVLENFPFIEADFDALTNYQIMCKMVEYMNNISKNQNLVQTNMIELNNWFNNLDVQEEINNKLDSMAESGELQEIIESYLNSNCIVAFDTLNDLKNGENLIDGSFACTYGLDELYDGKGSFYKIKTITSSDIVDNINVVSLNTSNTLIAIKIKNNEIDIINSERTILLGDSYSLYRPEVDGIEGWAIPLKRLLNLSDNDCYIIQNNGGGFIKEGSHGTWLNGITNLEVDNKDTIKNIIVCGGLNDMNSTKNVIKNAIQTFITYCKTNYPNAKVYIGMIGWDNDENYNFDNQYSRYKVLREVLPAYQECNEYGGIYLNGVENVMHNYSEYYDTSHPNQNMCLTLAYYIYQALKNGYASITYDEHLIELINSNVSTESFTLSERIINNNTIIFDFSENGSVIKFNSNYPVTDNNKFYISAVNLKYIRNVYPNNHIVTCPAIITDTNDRTYNVTCSLYIKNWNYLHCHFASTEILDGLTIKSIKLFNPYSSKPTITQ